MDRRLKFEDIELGEQLAAGGFAAVFKAKVKGKGGNAKNYVAKCIKDVTTGASASNQRRFQKELEVLCQVNTHHVQNSFIESLGFV